MYHYVYRITNILINKHYYGKRSSKIHPKEDLGVKYFSSCGDKAFINDQKDNPQNYKYKVVFTYDTAQKALAKEIYLHNYFEVAKSLNFYNKAKQTSTKCDVTGTGLVVNIYCYYTNKLLAKKVIARDWCEEHNYCTPSLMRTLIGDPSKPHNSNYKSLKYNPCHTKGIYAVKYVYGETPIPKNFSKTHILESKNEHARKTGRSLLLVTIKNYFTEEVIAEKVNIISWCKNNKYDASALYKTLKADRDRPHSSNNKKLETFNLHHTNGVYAVLVK